MPAVFLFEGEEDLHVFATVGEARSWLEPADVREQVYGPAYLHDGTVLRIAMGDMGVEVQPTGVRDPDDLAERLRLYQQLWPRVPQTTDPLSYANEHFRREWESRWPQRPRWLDRLMHPHGPTVVASDE